MFISQPLSQNLASVSRRICELGAWNVSNLRLQKLLYICHMIFLGRTGKPLIDENFEAWMYGPVVPQLYQRMKAYGAKPVGDRFHNAEPLPPEVDAIVTEVCDSLKQVGDSGLVSITHIADGGWDRTYTPNSKGGIITKENILHEYRARTA